MNNNYRSNQCLMIINNKIKFTDIHKVNGSCFFPEEIILKYVKHNYFYLYF